jgi:BA14K-like protein
MNVLKTTLLAVACSASVLAMPAAASALPTASYLENQAIAAHPTQIRFDRFHRSHRGGAGVGVGIGIGILGAILLGNALNSDYNDGYDNSYTYDNYGYYDGPSYGGAANYCARRFRSYDAASGTYLGYDGRRHSCP